MKRNGARIYEWCVIFGFVIIVMTLPFFSLARDKPEPEEIVAKHLESIGSAETRASVHSRIAAGTVIATARAPVTGKYGGRAVMASDGNKNMIGMSFDAGQFQDKFGFDGREVSVGFERTGDRGYWGDFLLTHPNIIKEGLIGGTLSDAWPLLNSSEKKPKLEYRGIKKMAGNTAHEIKYVPRGSSDVEISLFFDTETFHHVRTEYTRVISAGLGTGVNGTGRSQGGAVDASGSQRTSRYKMVEDFSDFRKEGGLTLPHSYKIGLELDTRNGTVSRDWEFTLTEFAFNQPIPPATFNVNAKQ